MDSTLYNDETDGINDIDEDLEASESEMQRKVRSAATGRGITLSMLISDQVIRPGKNVLSIDYLGRKFVADLLPDGRIYWSEGPEYFNTPSAWAIHCKKLSNPDKKSGCGWASVKYLNRKLDSWKTTWYRYHHNHKQTQNQEEINSTTDKSLEINLQPVSCFSSCLEPESFLQLLSFSLVELEQPFCIILNASFLFFLGLRASLVEIEECGYLGGTWEFGESMCLHCLIPTKVNNETENHLRFKLPKRLCSDTICGWYHFHHGAPACPTLADAKYQYFCQEQCRYPCMACIVSTKNGIADRCVFYMIVKNDDVFIPVLFDSQIVADSEENFERVFKDFVHDMPPLSQQKLSAVLRELEETTSPFFERISDLPLYISKLERLGVS